MTQANETVIRPAVTAAKPGLAARVLLSAIHAYQRRVSPSLGMLCRYQPTCSAYACEAIERHGALRGALLSISRLLRCTPLGRGGWDPVP